jgi:uncharacterized membrane protein
VCFAEEKLNKDEKDTVIGLNHMGYDNFDSVDSGYGEWGDDSSPQQQAMAMGKKILPILVVLIIVGVVGYLAYDFFIGSIREVSFQIKDTENAPINDASIKVYDVSGEELYRGAGQSNHRMELRTGNFDVQAVAKGYKSIQNRTVTVGTQNTYVLKMEKNIDVELKDVEATFPKTLVVGQTLETNITVENDGSRTAEVELVFEGDLEDLIITTLPDPFTIAGNSSGTAVVDIEVPRSLEIGKDEKKLEGDIRVKFTNEKQSVEVNVFPTPEIKLGKVDFGGLDAGEQKTKTVSIQNKSKFPITDLTLTFEITNSNANNADDVKSWFKFNEIANQEDPRTLIIREIPKGKTINPELQVIVSKQAKLEEISGNLIVSANYLAQPIIAPLTIEVDKELAIQLQARISPSTGIKIDWIEEQGKYEEKPVKVNFRNRGIVPIENIRLSVENESTCHVGWLDLREQAIAVLEPGENRDLTIFASAPNILTVDEEINECKLRYRYDNPSDDPTQPSFIDGRLENFFYITAKK